MTRKWTLLAAALVSTTACAATSQFNKQVPVGPQDRVNVSNITGSVSITTWDRREIDVQGELDTGVDHVEVRQDTGNVDVKVVVKDGDWWNGQSQKDTEARLQIRMPADVQLDVNTVSADVTVSGVRGRMRLKSVSGDIRSSILGGAVDTDHVYWTQAYYQDGYQRGSIGRANLDGTGVDQTFIRTKKVPFALAVDGLTDTKLAGRASAPRTQRQGGKKVVVEVKVTAKERLTAKATGKVKVNPTHELRPQQVDLATGETRTLTLEPRKKAQATLIAAALKRGKKATAKLTVKLTDLAGNSETEKLSVRLKR